MADPRKKKLERRVLTEAEWKAEGKQRFGGDMAKWRFCCPVCGIVAAAHEWKDAGASEREIAFSCVGRHREDVDCNYAGGGLFRLNPITITHENGKESTYFEFAES